MREDSAETGPELQEPLEPDLTELRRLVQEAGDATVAPNHLDLSGLARAGRRRTRRRHAFQAMAGLAAAGLVVGLAVLPGGPSRADPAPAAPSPSPSVPASTPSPQTTVTDEPLAAVLADPASGLSQVVFSDERHASAMLSLCTGGCTSYVLVTSDAWRTWHAMPAPLGGGQLVHLADGSALAVSADLAGHAVLTVLHPDATAAPVRESADEVLFGPGLQLVPRTIVMGKASSTGAAYWAYDASSETVRPVRLTAPGHPCADPVVTPDGALVVLTRKGDSATSPVLVDRSTDSGRTWTSTLVPSRKPGAPYAAVGPGGRLAVAFGPVADDVNPFGELQVSTDGGRTWSASQVTGGRPATVSGLAWTSDGSLLLAEDIPGRLWVLPPGGPLQPAQGAPPGQTALGTTAGIVSSQTSPRRVWWSTDGRTWSGWTLPTSVPNPDQVLVPNPSNTPGS
jgi:photosystem II stability/assembly factor-like uncharacterized protein